MKKLFAVVFTVALTLGFTAGCEKTEEPKEITILQNKPEIDAQLKEFAKVFEEKTGIIVNVKSCGGDSCQVGTQLKADFAAGEAPDIFPIDGLSSYDEWSDYILDVSDQEWVKDTDFGFMVDGKTVGFPVAIEGWGMAYNKDLLDKAGIDPATLTNYGAYRDAFRKLDEMKDELGIDSVVSMAAGPGMEWVTSHHNLNSYLSNGLDRNDMSITNDAVKGILDADRFAEYSLWVKLLFDYSDKTILTTGGYDQQVGAFANQKAVFLHQGNWVEGNLIDAGADFARGFAPHGSMSTDTDGIFVSTPSWYVVNKDSENADLANQFLNFMASSPEGHDYMVNKINAIPAFKSVTISPSAPLSADILKWSAEGKTYAWNQYHLPDAFRGQQLGPIYGQLANGEIGLGQFMMLIEEEFKTLK